MIRLPLSVDPQHPAFAGHFPGHPVVPGVVLLDETIRAIALHRGVDPSALVCGIGAAKFLSFVLPGEALRLEVEPSSDATRYRVRVIAGDVDAERVAMSGDVAVTASIAMPAPGAAT